MPDPTISAIDRFFDFVDDGAEKLDQVFNRNKRSEDKLREQRARGVSASKVTQAPSHSTAIARRQFRIIEAIDATTGQEVFTVTAVDGSTRAECSSRAMAEKLLRALEAAP